MNGRVAMDWLIVEDLAMMFVLMLLPGLRMSLEGSTGQLCSAFRSKRW
jgi:predicted Kef-type K+ transport protein